MLTNKNRDMNHTFEESLIQLRQAQIVMEKIADKGSVAITKAIGSEQCPFEISFAAIKNVLRAYDENHLGKQKS